MKRGKRVKIMVSEDQLSLAIGKRGQKCAADLQVDGMAGGHRSRTCRGHGLLKRKMARAVQALATIAGITQEQASVLVHHGFPNLEALLQAEVADLAEIPQIGDQAAAILEAARAEVSRRSFKVGETSVAS